MLDHLHYQDSILSLFWQDGSVDAYTSDWLRDNAPDSARSSGQKSYSILDIPEHSSIVRALQQGDCLELCFSPDQYTLNFPIKVLKGRSQQSVSDRSEWTKQLWHGGSEPLITDTGLNQGLLKHLPRWSLEEFTQQPEAKYQALETFLKLGVFLLYNLPAKDAQVLEVIKQFGFVRETNYGQLFNVQSIIDPKNQAFTRMGLDQHTDNPYRDPVPTVQLLHCLSNSASGGDSFLLDGFYAASILRKRHQDDFKILTEYEVPFEYQDEQTHLRSAVRMIETGQAGDIRQVRYNHRSIASVQLPLEQQKLYYPAYRHWAATLAIPGLRLRHKLQPGEVLVFDNTRVMHGRYGYDTGGSRHLQGAYSDLDGLYSTLYTLRKQYGDCPHDNKHH